MQGNHLMTPQHRLLLAAGAFAVLALVALGAVWLWPMLARDGAATEGFVPLTEDQKEDIRAQLREQMRQGEGVIVSEEEQQDIRTQLTNSDASSEPVVSDTEQDDIRAQLRAQMQQ